jgi:hypothetical protein
MLICKKFGALHLAITTWKTKHHILKSQDLRLLLFHYIIFSYYSFVQCITIIFVLNDQTREIQMNGMAKYLAGVPLCFFMVGAQWWWRYGGNFIGMSCGRPRRPALTGDAAGQRCSPL